MGDSNGVYPWLQYLNFVFRSPNPRAPEMTAFYPKGAPMDNPFYPHYDERSQSIILLSPSPQGLDPQKDFLTQTLVTIAGPPQSPTSIRVFRYSTSDGTLREVSTSEPLADVSEEEVAIMEIRFESLEVLSKEAMMNLLAYTHAASALSLIGCATRVTR